MYTYLHTVHILTYITYSVLYTYISIGRTKLDTPLEKARDLLGGDGGFDSGESGLEVFEGDWADVALGDGADRVLVEAQRADRAEVCLGAQLPHVRARVALGTLHQRVQLRRAQHTVQTRQSASC